MYKVTVEKKEGYEKVELNYESRTDAFLAIENIFTGDLDNNYVCKIEIVNEEDR